ncbi:hypothetical protein K6I33_005412 [Streptomyces sp. UNOB3_S3]|nr:hypothetical protein [Streptomyces sp. UNOB3_S3]
MRALTLVRDLTSHGIAVDWRPALDGEDESWRRLSHLYPPGEVVGRGGERVRDAWRESYFFCKCFYRHGPGFLQVRDWRTGELRRITIDDPAYRAAVEPLLHGQVSTSVAPAVLDAFTGAGLVDILGEYAWWMPYRVRRWPQSHTTV